MCLKPQEQTGGVSLSRDGSLSQPFQGSKQQHLELLLFLWINNPCLNICLFLYYMLPPPANLSFSRWLFSFDDPQGCYLQMRLPSPAPGRKGNSRLSLPRQLRSKHRGWGAAVPQEMLPSRHPSAKHCLKKVEGSISVAWAQGIKLPTPVVILWSMQHGDCRMLLTKNVTLPFLLVKESLSESWGH